MKISFVQHGFFFLKLLNSACSQQNNKEVSQAETATVSTNVFPVSSLAVVPGEMDCLYL
ncbi:MAG: hypothetical protein ABIT96_01350 [Ferruginibacter sp.]